MDMNQFHIAKEIGAASVGESDVKFDEALFELTNSARRRVRRGAVLRCYFRRSYGQGVGEGTEKGRGGDVQEARRVRDSSD